MSNLTIKLLQTIAETDPKGEYVNPYFIRDITEYLIQRNPNLENSHPELIDKINFIADEMFER